MYEIAATRGRATLDYHAGTLARYAHPEGDAVTPQGLDVGAPVEVVRVPERWERNDIFVAEIQYFLDCLARGETPTPGVAEGIASTRLAQTLANGGQWKGATKGTVHEQA